MSERRRKNTLSRQKNQVTVDHRKIWFFSPLLSRNSLVKDPHHLRRLYYTDICWLRSDLRKNKAATFPFYHCQKRWVSLYPATRTTVDKDIVMGTVERDQDGRGKWNGEGMKKQWSENHFHPIFHRFRRGSSGGS